MRDNLSAFIEQEQERTELAELSIGGGAVGGYSFLRPDGTIDLDLCGVACAKVKRKACARYGFMATLCVFHIFSSSLSLSLFPSFPPTSLFFNQIFCFCFCFSPSPSLSLSLSHVHTTHFLFTAPFFQLVNDLFEARQKLVAAFRRQTLAQAQYDSFRKQYDGRAAEVRAMDTGVRRLERDMALGNDGSGSADELARSEKLGLQFTRT
jgi:hypothetical protein